MFIKVAFNFWLFSELDMAERLQRSVTTLFQNTFGAALATEIKRERGNITTAVRLAA